MQQHQLNTSHAQVNFDEKAFHNEDLNVTKHDGEIPRPCNEPFRSASYSLILILKGKLNLKTNFVQDSLKERDIVFVFPGSIHEIEQPENVSFIRIGFNKDYLKRQGVFLGSAESYRLFREHATHKFSLSKEEFNDILNDILALQKKLKLSPDTPHIKDIVRNSFLEILYDLFLINNKRNAFVPIKHDSKTELTTRFLTLLSENFRKEKRVQYYANVLCITSRHLSQVVKQVTDRTAGELIDEMVIGEAKILLTGHILNVSEVAETLNFSNSSFFGKYFKKNTGFSPSEYKTANNIAQTPPF
ncbi:helix-turn-helix domain-containing protein [Pedobacter nototheniae]|uniref:helix-turn-helix domain-containing protein n=1 Tax=Pedobacter nototheniae TaxID=2488994 RepID=UPI00103A51D2|nr:helix-turn-helix domain-containing protein [Pedobacter nototheniae]